MADKIKLGVTFFDDCFGGVSSGCQVLCHGRSGSGKSILACHFLNQALLDGDAALLLTGGRARDTITVAEGFGMPFSKAAADKQLTLLEYASFMQDQDASANPMLPPQAFMDLQAVIARHSVRRLVFDTVLPWVDIHPVTRIAEHVYSFTHALERLGVTSLLTLTTSVSDPSFTLKNRLEDDCPVAIHLDYSQGAHRVAKVTKYLGDPRALSAPMPFVIVPGTGIVSEAPPALP